MSLLYLTDLITASKSNQFLFMIQGDDRRRAHLPCLFQTKNPKLVAISPSFTAIIEFILNYVEQYSLKIQ